MHDLVLGHAAVKLGAVGDGAERGEGADEAHLLFEPPVRRRPDVLPRAGMAATGIGPQSAGVIFADVTLLQQLAAHAVPHDHREGTMEGAGAVRLELAGGADNLVARIDEDHQLLLIAHGGLSLDDTDE